MRLNQLISSAVSVKSNYTVIMGDFNYPGINWNDWSIEHNETHAEFQFIECLRDNFLSQEIVRPTRYRTGQTANILDLVLVDRNEIVDNIQYSSGLGASDHISFSMCLICNPELKNSST